MSSVFRELGESRMGIRVFRYNLTGNMILKPPLFWCDFFEVEKLLPSLGPLQWVRHCMQLSQVLSQVSCMVPQVN